MLALRTFESLEQSASAQNLDALIKAKCRLSRRPLPNLFAATRLVAQNFHPNKTINYLKVELRGRNMKKNKSHLRQLLKISGIKCKTRLKRCHKPLLKASWFLEFLAILLSNCKHSTFMYTQLVVD